MSNNLFHFTTGRENAIIKLVKVGEPHEISLVYSLDGENWIDYIIGQEISLPAVDDKVYFRAKTKNANFSKDDLNYYKFEFPEFYGVGCSGNIQYLLDDTGEQDYVPEYCFYRLFYIGNGLVQAPELPATIMASNCYDSMFFSAYGSYQAPELPAMTLAPYCYQMMFALSSIETPPKLPATILTEGCYLQMFDACHGIKLSTTKDSIYKRPFRIPKNGTGTNANDALFNMFSRTDGTFKGTPAINTTYYGAWDEYFDITYETSHSETPETKTVEYGHLLTEEDLPELEADGYDFHGWFYKQGISENFNFRTFYFKEEPQNLPLIYSLIFVEPQHFVSDNQTFHKIDSSIKYGSIRVYNSGWLKDNYRLLEFSMPKNNDALFNLENGYPKANVGDEITEDTVLVAVWTIKQFDITYETEYGEAPTTKTVNYGYQLRHDDEVDDLPILEHEGLLCAGWLYPNEHIARAGQPILADTLLTARWVVPPEPIPEPKPYLFGNRHGERYDYVRVAWENWQEHETYNHILDGSIELSTDAETKVTGNFNFEGYDTPDVNDLIRVYYRYLDDKNVEFREPVATLVVSYADLTLVDTKKGVKANGTLNGQSVLSILSNAIVGVPYTVKKNQNVVYVATQIAQEVGLQVNAEPSSFVMTKDYTFDADTNKLQIVNELLAMASFRPCYPDANGIIQMVSGTDSSVSFIFQNDDKSIMLPEIVQKNDWQSTPNVVRMLYNIDDACIEAWAKNVSGSKASLTNRGNREITYYEEIGELGAGNKANSLKMLAENKLLELSADIEYVTFGHAYVPISIYDLIEIRYADYEWTGTIDNMSINLAPSTECQTQIKRTMAQEISIQSQAIVLRGA